MSFLKSISWSGVNVKLVESNKLGVILESNINCPAISSSGSKSK